MSYWKACVVGDDRYMETLQNAYAKHDVQLKKNPVVSQFEFRFLYFL
jgi:hypothetical protein